MSIVSKLATIAGVFKTIGEGMQSEYTRTEKRMERNIASAKAEDEKLYAEQRNANIARQMEYNQSLTDQDREEIKTRLLMRTIRILQQKTEDES